MHVEAGGSTTTEGAVNDADIRALIGAASGGPNLAFYRLVWCILPV